MPLLLGALVAGYLFWLRDSPLVAINDVEVKGITGPEASEVTAALTQSASEMTTLNLSEEKLEAATEAFPTVVSLTADPKLLHGLVIDVTERKPALTAHVAGQSVPVTRDGTLLRGVELGDDGDALPVLDLSALPRSPRLEGEALQQAVVLGATPAAIRPLVEDVGVSGDDGVEVTLTGGIPVVFGTRYRARAKWGAAAAILADPQLTTFTHIDVRTPERAAVGGAGSPTAAASAEGVVDPTL